MKEVKDLLIDLNPAQRRAVISKSKKILCIAGAGAGKTKVLTTRIAQLCSEGISGENILCLTFTRLAGYEMKARLEKLIGSSVQNIYCNTFHAFCVKMFKQFGHLLGLDNDFIIYDNTEKEELIEEIIKELHFDKVKIKDVEDILDNNIALSPKLYSAKEVAEEYKYRLKRNNATDLNLLLIDAVNLLHNKEVQEYYHNQYQYVFVDEVQDTNDVQIEFLNLLSPNNLFLCGDDAQSIYGFRNAKIEYILKFAKDPSYELIKVEKNYRSTKSIINASNALIKHNNQIEKTLIAEKEGELIEFYELDTPKKELLFIAKTIQKSMQESPKQYKNFTILARTNKELLAFEDTFKQFNIPYNFVNKSDEIFKHPYVKMLIDYINAAYYANNDIFIKRVINSPVKRLQSSKVIEIELNALREYKTLFEVLEEVKNEEIVKLIKLLKQIEKSNLLSLPASKAISELKEMMYPLLIDTDITVFIELSARIKQWEKAQKLLEIDISLLAFLQWLKMQDTSGTQEEENAVKLMTVHASKGLEFDTVFLIGMNQDNFPNKKSDIGEERRLCYVAMTRAKEKLYMTRSKEKVNPWTSKTEKTVKSQFVKEALGGDKE